MSDTPNAVRALASAETELFANLAGRAVYLVGIGGCGMSGLARMMKSRGALVSGSDKEQSETTEALVAEGLAVGFDQSRAWLPEACDVVVATAAVRPDHPQLLEAQRRGVPVYLYAEALGRSMTGRTGVAIAGTHGKSTTTAMLGCALTDAGLDPTVIVGATSVQLSGGCLKPNTEGHGGGTEGTERRLDQAPTGFRLGGNEIPRGKMVGKPGILLAEACEFNRSFHNFRPTIASISSVEADHLDIYGSLDAVVEAFRDFARLVPSKADGGRLLIAHDGAHRREVTAGLDCEVQTIGYSPEADWVVGYEPATRKVTVSHEREVVAGWTNLLPGAHNAMNAATAFVLGTWLGGDAAVLGKSLGAFRGIDRRMQFLGERPMPSGGVVRVYDDYGHHPTEIDCTLRALRETERPQDRAGRLVCVFQPHQHSRTRHLMEEFASSFSQADIVIVPQIYFVRDSQEEKQKVDAKDLVDRLRDKGVRAMHLHPFEAIVEQLENVCRGGDLLVVMGAGPVWQVARGFLKA
jgi:UDP-N-acetylmuramate--alanine ligase